MVKKFRKVGLRGRIGRPRRERSYNGGTFKGRYEIQDKPMFKKRFSYQVSSNFSNASTNRVPYPKPQ